MRSFVLPLLLLAACASSSASGPRQEPAPEEETREQALKQAEQRRRNFQGVLVKLDQAMESYSQAMANRGSPRADQQITQLDKLIQEMVLDVGPKEVKKGMAPHEPGHNYQLLQAAAIDGSKPREQAIALAALGFSSQIDMMPIILQGAQLADQTLVDRAVFGLAVLRAPATPPGVIAAVVDNAKFSEASRTQAAWALYTLQEVSQRREEIVAAFRRFVTEKQDTMPAGVIVQSVRGLGLTRDPAHIEVLAVFLKSPVPKIRESAAVAMGRMNAQKHASDLIAMIGPQESVPNVRLAARKALQELAGQADYGYDVAAWRKAFDRGQ